MSESLAVNAEMLRRFDRPGPRYTSYPSPSQFGPHFDADMLRTYIRQSNADPIPRRLSLHLHVPRLNHVPGSGRSKQATERSRVYVERLIREAELLGTLFDRDREVVQLHLGGAPCCLTSDDLSELLASVRSQFCLRGAPDPGFSIELDPQDLREDCIAAYLRLGFSHADIRVVDGRVDDIERWVRTIERCREQGFRSLSLSMHPAVHSADDFERFLEAAISTRPDRLAFHEHSHVSYLAGARRFDRSSAPASPSLLQQIEIAFDRLRTAGYEHLGLEQFVQRGDEWLSAQGAGTLQRNLLGYSAYPDCDFIGLGTAAISHVGDCFSQNARELHTWEQAIDAGRLPVWRGRHLDFDDTLRAEVIRQIVCLGGVDISTLERRFLIDFRRYFADACARLATLEGDGLVTIASDRIVATSRGRWLLRIIATCFDRYFNDPFEPALPRNA